MRRAIAVAGTAMLAFASEAISTRVAHAEVVLEQYSVARPDEADEVMPILRDEFARNHAVSSPAYLASSLFNPPRPAIVDATLTSEALIDELELAAKSYIKVQYNTALVQLTSALAHASGNCGLIVKDDKVKYAMTRAQVALALTYKKLAEKLGEKIAASPKPIDPKLLAMKKDLDAKAYEAMTTYVRSSRDPVMRSMFGPPGEELYSDVRKKLDPAKRATLSISVNEPDAQLFVNGLIVGRGATFAADQLPGAYCIVVRVGNQMLRYDVTMEPGRPVALTVDWSFDSVFNVSDHWVGLTTSMNPPEAKYVRSISQRMGGQISIIFVGLRRERGYLAVYGCYFDKAYQGGVLRRRGEIHVANAHDESKLREFVRFLVAGQPSRDIVPIGSIEDPPPSHDERPWRAYAAGAGAVGALALGGYGLFKEYGCNRDPECKYKYTRAATVGYVSIGAGVALGALALYWFVHEPKPTSGIAVVPLRSGATVNWTRSF